MNDTGAKEEGVRIEEGDRGDNTDNICQTEKSQVGPLSLKPFNCCCDVMACLQKQNKAKEKATNQKEKKTECLKKLYLEFPLNVPSNGDGEPPTNVSETCLTGGP